MSTEERKRKPYPTSIKPWFGDAPRSTVPDIQGYTLVSHDKLRIGQVSIIGLVLIPLWFLVFYIMMEIFGGPTSFEGSVSLTRIVTFVIVIAIVVVLHEGIHGFVARLFGVKPSFGVGPGFFYMTFLEPMGRNAYFAVGIAPVVIISIVSVIIAILWPSLAGWALVASLFNISGAGGDLWMARRIAHHSSKTIFFDLADGFAAFIPDTAVENSSDDAN